LASTEGADKVDPICVTSEDKELNQDKIAGVNLSVLKTIHE
jgi:hypothetical protein